MKRNSRKYVFFLIGIIVGHLLTNFIANSGEKVEVRYVSKDDHVGIQRTVDMDLFWDVWELIDEGYVDVDQVEEKDDRVYGAISGMLESLDDPYTAFMDPKAAKEFELSLGGEIEGIGAEVVLKSGLVTVVSPLKNTPASLAGIRPGDIITEVDGESTEDMTLHEAVMKIRGPRGTNVKLKIFRKSIDETLEFELTRRRVKFDSVEWEMLEDNIAYIELSQFDDNTIRQLKSATTQILLEEVDGIILDVRFNSGGYLDVARDVLSEFLEGRQKILSVKGRNPEDNENMYTLGKARLDEVPLVILMNEGSASASEIVAGAIQDLERGTLIGKKTFGKGSVQELRSLDGGSSIRYTTAKWYTPNDNNIHEEGIDPDIEVGISEEQFNEDEDPQLDCAIEFLTTGSCTIEEEAAAKE